MPVVAQRFDDWLSTCQTVDIHHHLLDLLFRFAMMRTHTNVQSRVTAMGKPIQKILRTVLASMSSTILLTNSYQIPAQLPIVIM
ncbi:uncharacterized protein LACBIDRAFT_305527 [Laccaria bicolor S238N-H82]|uniref:Predicted protein n=1 Tax=Laccaria bicolor (strain S238N-H82 / ATCC MYA-4686) TaxID=486041 RepID=B0CUG6_LACBS|nr:uncharacterized protein LACBIDRAFT_305527 [Laccaria bicolor S238N-H82]EDR14667.1 predicted protein [Laccaria bicolor S238N-H82]|eukprot:XP_001875226.1 predicted protein [Laccaria bicolor S238N-H82]